MMTELNWSYHLSVLERANKKGLHLISLIIIILMVLFTEFSL